MTQKGGLEGQIDLPPGFRFFPTDEELVVHYLCNKVVSHPLPAFIIGDVDLYKYDPWHLPSIDQERFFHLGIFDLCI